MKTRVSITIDPELWQQFRVACVTRKTNASCEIEGLVRGLLKSWEQKRRKKK